MLSETLAELIPLDMPTTRKVVAAMLATERPMSATKLTKHLGLTSVDVLRRYLRAEGATSVPTLKGWLTVLRLHERTERLGVGAANVLLKQGQDPAVFYRLVKRVTGENWGRVRELERVELIDRFIAICKRSQDTGKCS